MTYRRTGGIAGTDDRLVVWSDGFVQLAGRLFGTAGGRLTDPELGDLRDLLADWHRTPEPAPATPAADAFLVQVTHAGRTLAAQDPSRAGEAFTRVREALEAVGRRVGAEENAPK